MAPGELAVMLGGAAAVVVVGWPAGELLFALVRSRETAPPSAGFLQSTEGGAIVSTIAQTIWLGGPEKALFAIAGFVAFSAALMVAHIVTGGAVFGVPGIVPVAAIAVIAVWRRFVYLGLPRPRPRDTARTAGLAAALLLLYVAPVVIGGSGVRTGDPPWHLGWTEQLLGGEPVPTGPAPQYGRNAYPWGLHAVMATTVRLVPGGDPIAALDSLHLLIALCVPLGAACLARRLDARAGWPAAAAAGLIGGFGWLGARGPEFSTSPGAARFGGDLVVASPNSVYELLPPALPRELGLILVALAGVLICFAATRATPRFAPLAGAVVGLVGLVSLPMFVSAVAWMVAGAVAAGRGARRYLLVRMVIPALGVVGLWAGPVVAGYLRFGGFVNITPQLGREWPLWTALASWGLLLPVALAGVAAMWGRYREKGAGETTTGPPRQHYRALAAFGIATIVLLMLAIARGAFGWDLWGNATLLHQGRVWPPLHLLAAVAAGLGLAHGYRRMRARWPAFAGAAVVVLLGVGVLSLVLASVRITGVLSDGAAGFVYSTEDVAAGSFARRAAAVLGPGDVVMVQGSDRLAFLLFELSGVRLAAYDDPGLAANDLRIRYADLARSWDERMASFGFEAGYLVRRTGADGAPEALAEGAFAGASWELVAIP